MNCISRVVANEESWEKRERERKEEEEEEKEKERLVRFKEMKATKVDCQEDELEGNTSSLQEVDHPKLESSYLRIGGWLRKRREITQLEGMASTHHKKPRISPPEDQDDQQEKCQGGPFNQAGGGRPYNK